MNQHRLDEIRKEDNARRAAQSDELIKLALAYYGAPDDYHVSRGITGEPSEKNRTYRATEDCWTKGMKGRTVGIAPGTAATFASVAVTKDGETTIVSANSFRKKNIATKSRKHNEAEVDRQNKERHITTSADLAPIGNVE